MSAKPKGQAASRRTMFEAALEVLPELLLIHDEERILFTNAACREFLGAETPGDLEGRPIDVIIHPDAYAAGRERRKMLISADRPLRDIPFKLVTLDGEAKRRTGDAHPLALGDVRAAMVVVQADAR